MSLEINLIEGERGKLHVTSDDARTENAVIFGRGRKVLNMDEMFDAVLIGNNTVRILSGVLYNNGTFIRIDREDYKEVNIENGLSGTYRNDFICIRYERNIQTHIESAHLVVKKGTASENTALDPTCTEGNILDFDSVDEFPLYRVRLDGIHPTLDPMFEVADAMDNSTLYEKIRYQQQVDASMQQELAAHQQNDRNPHYVTKEQLGLGNVDNTSDMNKPVSNLQEEYIKGIENSLRSYINDIARVTELALNKASNHIADKNNPHGVTKAQVGLSNVDDTPDKDKNVKYSDSTGKLSKAVKINGVDFDGSKDIQIGDGERNMITDTATGENITVTNSTDAPVRSLRIDGKTEQFTTTGKNKLPTINSTSIIDVYSTAPTVKENSITGGHRYGFKGFEGFSGYTFSVKMRHADTTSTSKATFLFKDSNGTTIKEFHFNRELKNKAFYEMIIPEDSVKVWIDYGSVSTAELYDFQIEEGTVATEYEPYTGGIPSPNPNYPQDIKGVGESGNVEVTVTGKNLFKITVNGSATVSGVTFTVDNDKIIANGTATTETAQLNIGQVTLPKGEYIVSGGISNNAFFFLNEGSNYINVYQENINLSVSAETTYRVWCKVNKNETANNVVFCPSITRANEVKTVSIPVSSPLYEWDSVTLKNGKLEVCRKNANVVFDGSDDEGWAYNNQYFYSSIITKTIANIYSEFYCDYFMSVDINTSILTKDNSIGLRDTFVAINCSKFTTLTEWKTWLSQNPITVVYQLVEPIIETMATDIDLSTYNHVTNITNSDGANMEVEYFTNSANGEVIVDLQEEIKRLDNEKVAISLLKDYVKKIQMQINKISVPAHTSIDYDYLIDEHDYTPILANVSVINTTDSNPVVCLKSCFDVSMTHAEFQLHNMSDSICDADVLLEVIYVRNI